MVQSTVGNSESLSDLLARVAGRQYKIGIIGLGYVGIPLALTACKAGFPVVGFDIDTKRVAQINRGESFIKHIPTEAIAAAIKEERFRATTDFDELRDVDAIIIAVPTPLTKHREPDLSYVEATARAIAPRLRKGHLVVLESTTWPGTTDEVMRPIFEKTGLKSGTDFYLAFSPSARTPAIPISAPRPSPRSSAAMVRTRWSWPTPSMARSWSRPCRSPPRPRPRRSS